MRFVKEVFGRWLRPVWAEFKDQCARQSDWLHGGRRAGWGNPKNFRHSTKSYL